MPWVDLDPYFGGTDLAAHPYKEWRRSFCEVLASAPLVGTLPAESLPDCPGYGRGNRHYSCVWTNGDGLWIRGAIFGSSYLAEGAARDTPLVAPWR